MSIAFHCPKCNTAFRVADEYAGKQGKCSKCGAEIAIPATSQTSLQPTSRSAPRPSNSDEMFSAIQKSAIVAAPEGAIAAEPNPTIITGYSRLTYGALTVGVLLFLVGRLLRTPPNVTVVALILDVLATGIIWVVVLGMIALIPAARRVKALWLPIFAWLLFAAAVFEVAVGSYTRFILEPKIKASLSGLIDDTYHIKK